MLHPDQNIRFRNGFGLAKAVGIGPVPPQLWLSDPKRNADILALSASVPMGHGLIYRHFGCDARFDRARAAAAICKQRGVLFLVSVDPELAASCSADGMHVPETMQGQIPRLLRQAPGMHITAACHSARSARRALSLGADAVLLSPVFPSHSPSATKPMGLCRFLNAARDLPGDVYALGGVGKREANILLAMGLGTAHVSGLRANRHAMDMKIK